MKEDLTWADIILLATTALLLAAAGAVFQWWNRFEEWFNGRWGWFFTNGRKLNKQKPADPQPEPPLGAWSRQSLKR